MKSDHVQIYLKLDKIANKLKFNIATPNSFLSSSTWERFLLQIQIQERIFKKEIKILWINEQTDF